MAAAVWLAMADVVAMAQPRSAMRQERAFAARLQDAVRAQDRAAVADLLRYPARVSVRLRPFPIYVENRAALLQMYDMVFTPQMRCAIVASKEQTPGQPAPKDALLLARGVVSLAGGRIVAERSGRGMLITRLSSFGDTSTRGGTPRPVAFDGTRRYKSARGDAGKTRDDAGDLAGADDRHWRRDPGRDRVEIHAIV